VTKKPSAGQLAGALLICRQDLERQGQQVHNVMLRIQALAAENAALRRAQGEPPPPPPPPPLADVQGILSRRQQAAYDLTMGRPLEAARCAELIADIDSLVAALQGVLLAGEA
jgi:hypothetical protein